MGSNVSHGDQSLGLLVAYKMIRSLHFAANAISAIRMLPLAVEPFKVPGTGPHCCSEYRVRPGKLGKGRWGRKFHHSQIELLACLQL